MRRLLQLTAGLMVLALPSSVSNAASLQVSPVRLDLSPGAAASTVTLANSGSEQVATQVRVFRWVQENGEEKLVPTRDVVVSPPIVELGPGKSNVVRIVRTLKTPVEQEESYRLIVDQIPQADQGSGLAIKFRLRYSIPVFFAARNAQGPQMSWAVESHKGTTVIDADNSGNRHLRLAKISVVLPSGKTVRLAEGLAGYVLAGSHARLSFSGGLSGVKPGQTVTILAEGNDNPFRVQAQLR